MKTLVLFFALIVAVSAAEVCPRENCIPSSQCEQVVRGDVRCDGNENICCSVVRSEFRTACRHHGGECMDSCAQSLMRDVVDCPDKVCCVLV